MVSAKEEVKCGSRTAVAKSERMRKRRVRFELDRNIVSVFVPGSVLMPCVSEHTLSSDSTTRTRAAARVAAGTVASAEGDGDVNSSDTTTQTIASASPPPSPPANPNPKPKPNPSPSALPAARAEAVELHIGFFNAAGLPARPCGPRELCDFAHSSALALLCLSETWSHGHELRDTTGRFRALRGVETPCTAFNGGRNTKGMAAYFRRDNPHWRCTPQTQWNTACTQWLLLRQRQPSGAAAGVSLYVCSAYVPTGAAATLPRRADVWQHIRDVVDELRGSAKHATDDGGPPLIVIGGDLNGHVGLCSDGAHNADGDDIRHFCLSHNFTLLNETAPDAGQTFRPYGRADSPGTGNTLDFVLVSEPAMPHATAFAVHSDAALQSDHRPISATFTFAPPPDDRDSGDADADADAPNAAPKRAPYHRGAIADNADLLEALNDVGTAIAGACHEAHVEGVDRWSDRDAADGGDAGAAGAAGTVGTADAAQQRVDALVAQLTDGIIAAAKEHCPPLSPGERSGSAPMWKRYAKACNQMRRDIASAARAVTWLLRHRPVPMEIAAARRRLVALRRKRRRLERAWQRRRDSVLTTRLLRRQHHPAAALEALRRDIAPTDRARARYAGHSIPALRTADGKLVHDQRAIAEELRRHFAAIGEAPRADDVDDGSGRADVPPALRRREDAGPAAAADAATLTCAVDPEEVESAIQRLATRKAAGPDEIVNELLKVDAKELHVGLAKLFTLLIGCRRWPTAWGVGTVVPIAKSTGKRTDASSYRGISLLSVLCKVFESVLNARLSNYFEQHQLLCDAQHGFRAARNTSTASFLLHEAVASARERAHASRLGAGPAHSASGGGGVLHLAFLDVAKAYDVCWRDAVLSQLRARNVPDELVELIGSMLARGRVKRRVRVGAALSDAFDVDTGVPQGAVISPLLYSVFIDDIAATLEQDPRGFGVDVGGRRLCILLYADDIVLLARSRQQLQQMLDVCGEFARARRFAYNIAKCNVMVVACGGTRTRAIKQLHKHPLRLADASGVAQPLTRVDRYRYLGLTADWNEPMHYAERWRRVVNTQRGTAYRYMHHLFAVRARLPLIAPRTLALAFQSYIRPQTEVGAELWAPLITSTQRAALDSAQSVFLRHALVRADGESVSRTNPIPAVFAESECALMRPSMRVQVLALRFLHRLEHAPPDSALRAVHAQRWADARAIASDGANFGVAARQSWHYAMREVCHTYGLDQYWTGETPIPEDVGKWNAIVARHVRRVWVNTVRCELAQHDGTRYMSRRRRATIRPAAYLNITTRNTAGRALTTLLRCGALPIGTVAARLLERVRNVERTRIGADGTDELCAVTNDDIARALHCPECALRGRREVDGFVHFAALCDAALFRDTLDAVAHKLHDALHDAARLPRDACDASSRADNGDSAFDFRAAECAHHECHAVRVAHRLLAMPVVRQTHVLLSGWDAKLLADTCFSARSDAVRRATERALAHGMQELARRRWSARTAALGGEPVLRPLQRLGMQACIKRNGVPRLLLDELPPLPPLPPDTGTHTLSAQTLCIFRARSLYARKNALVVPSCAPFLSAFPQPHPGPGPTGPTDSFGGLAGHVL